MDIVDKQTRSRTMAGIGSKDTKPELAVRRYLHRSGFRFHLHIAKLPEKPDLVLPKHQTVIFVKESSFTRWPTTHSPLKRGNLNRIAHLSVERVLPICRRHNQ
jgi:DNA mismatch endonuclease (patch repair protein)